MAKTNDSKTGTISVQVKATLQPSSSGDKAPLSTAYAFSDTGRFLASAEVSGDGSAVLTIPGVSSARDIRVVAGPSIEGEQAPALSDLTRRGASEQFVRIQPGARTPVATFEIGSEIWRCWYRRCTVQGTLLKSVITGGLPVDLPVCGATVQIWEVEPIELILPKLPISIIEKLRHMVIGPIPKNPGDPGPVEAAVLSAGVKYAQPVPTLTAVPPAAPEFPSLQVLAQTTEGEAFRQALSPYISILRPWFCELIPRWVTKTLVGTVTTDRCGHFKDVILLGCYAPNPNLYFTASIPFIFGSSITIYAPTPISCYTHWDYQCGTEVTLYTSSPFAPGCSPCAPVNAAENYVLFRAIGGVELNSIYGASPLLPNTPLGLAAGAVVPGEDSPFGGLLLPRVEFDSSLLENNLASYYQISYWDTTLSNWLPLTGDIFRHYNEFVGTELVTQSLKLGPVPVGTTPNLFAIPPALPPAGDWAFPNPHYDLANAQFPTTALPTGSTPPTFGLYQIKLDLYDSSGNLVNITTAGIKYYVPSTVHSDGTVDTVEASTLGLVSGSSLIVNLYIDNRPTQALLPGVSTPVNSTATDPCGILLYDGPSDVVDIQYVAYQPGNFIDWDLDVVRGITGSVASTSGNTSAGAPSPGSPVDFDNTVATLIGSCTQAAFGVNLNCYSRCTDGWNRQTQYNSSRSIAFALTIPCPPCPPCPDQKVG